MNPNSQHQDFVEPASANVKASPRTLRNLPLAMRNLHADEEGMISLIAVVVLLFFVVLLGLIINVGYTINRKLETQNSADAVAYSSAIWLARGMNVITASNHLIGEMQALVVLHAAIGGEKLEGKPPLDPEDENRASSKLDNATAALEVARDAFIVASLGLASSPAYPIPPGDHKVGNRVKSGATIRAAITDLRVALTAVYIGRTGGQIMMKFPITFAAGEAIDLAGQGIEELILFEYEALHLMEEFASNEGVLRIRNFLFDTLLPHAYEFERAAVESVPGAAADTARVIAQRNSTTGAIYPAEPKLPVLRDPPEGKKAEDDWVTRSPLVRTTYPWVMYDRTPILKLTIWMIISHTRQHYVKYTDHYAKYKSKELYNRDDYEFAMYVMTKPDETKGNEAWTNDSKLANRKFTVVGFAHRPAKTLASQSVFGVPNQEGIVACAQAIVYNANSQNPGSGGSFQPDVGWDTLNWRPPVSSSYAYEWKQGGDELHHYPRIKLNWQAKLVPLTRLREAADSGEVGSPFSGVLGRLGPNPKRLTTH